MEMVHHCTNGLNSGLDQLVMWWFFFPSFSITTKSTHACIIWNFWVAFDVANLIPCQNSQNNQVGFLRSVTVWHAWKAGQDLKNFQLSSGWNFERAFIIWKLIIFWKNIIVTLKIHKTHTEAIQKKEIHSSRNSSTRSHRPIDKSFLSY